MKHAANRTQSTVKVKAKTLAQTRAVKKAKPAAVKPVGKIASTSRPQTSVQKSTAVAKVAPKNSTRLAKPTAKQTASKLSAKTLNALKTLSVRKVKLKVKPTTTPPKAKKVELKITGETKRVLTTKAKPVASVKKVSASAKTAKRIAAPQKAKLKIARAKPKVSAKPIVKTLVKPAKSQSSKIAIRTAKPQKSKARVATSSAKIKAAYQKTKPFVAAKKPKNTEKTKPAAAKPVNRKKIMPIVAAKKAARQSKKIQPIVSAKKIVKKAAKPKLIAPIKKVGRLVQKMKPAISAATVNKRNPKIKETAQIKKIKAVEIVVEATQSLPPKPKNRKARPISSAVFRGKKERYDFKVFALNEKFEPIPAVYIISKRKTDRHKRGHHALICIGETASISDELKRHRRGKCVKKHEANVVSILPEADEKMRLKIETDLKAAHTVICNLD